MIVIDSVRSQSSQVESSRFLTTDLKSIFNDWLKTTWNDLNQILDGNIFYDFFHMKSTENSKL